MESPCSCSCLTWCQGTESTLTRGLVCETDTCIRKVYYTLVRHVLQVQTLKDKPEKETDTRLDSRVTRTPLIEHCKQERDEQAIPGEEAAITKQAFAFLPGTFRCWSNSQTEKNNTQKPIQRRKEPSIRKKSRIPSCERQLLEERKGK